MPAVLRPWSPSTALAEQARARLLAQEDREADRSRPPTRGGPGRVAARDQHAAAPVDRVREEVPEAAVLPGRHAAGAPLADGVRVDRPAGGVDDLHPRARAAGALDGRLEDPRL